MDTQTRYRGCLLGLATGDAVGTTLEFTSPGHFTPIQDMVGGGPFGLQAGQWTDDTSMALCLAESLVVCQGFSAQDQMERYVRWWQEGYWSSTGSCFDIGGTTRTALGRFRQTKQPMAGSTAPNTAGNGSIMRLAPVPMAYRRDPQALTYCAQSSQTTHAAPEAIAACQYLGTVLIEALNGASKESLLSPSALLTPILSTLPTAVAAIVRGSFREKEPPQIKGSGYVVASLEAALWAFARGQNFRESVLLAANLGDDADTTAAITGQIAGAFYGEEGIPAEWLAKLALREKIAALADDLYQFSEKRFV